MSGKQNSNEKREPTEKQYLELLGKKGSLWSELREYLTHYYPQCQPIFTVEGKDASYTIRYRKSGKTLVTLYPAEKDLAVLVVLGKKEIAKVEEFEEKLSKRIQEIFRNSKQYHDGRWLWIKPVTRKDLESIKMLLQVKRRPQKD
jgi:hypothetical protein